MSDWTTPWKKGWEWAKRQAQSWVWLSFPHQGPAIWNACASAMRENKWGALEQYPPTRSNQDFAIVIGTGINWRTGLSQLTVVYEARTLKIVSESRTGGLLFDSGKGEDDIRAFVAVLRRRLGQYKKVGGSVELAPQSGTR